MQEQVWKPIATAPKGIYLLLYTSEGFFSYDSIMEVGTIEQFGETATHWMALPTAPEVND